MFIHSHCCIVLNAHTGFWNVTFTSRARRRQSMYRKNIRIFLVSNQLSTHFKILI
jgi:hypothetical protein